MRNIFTFFLGIFMICCLTITSYSALNKQLYQTKNDLLLETDSVAPIVTDFKIDFTDDESTDSVKTVFTVTYSEGVQLNDTFSIMTNYFNGGVWSAYDVYDISEIVVQGNVIKVTPSRAFLSANRYEFIITWRSVKDSTGNYAGAVTRTFIADESGPEVVDLEIDLTYSQASDSVSAVFTLTYSENVKLGTAFSIVTHVSVNGAWEQYEAYDESDVNVVGNVITITPDRKFSASIRYELIIAFGAVTDLAGNMATSYTRLFIADVTPPQLTEFLVLLTDSESADSLDVTFTLTYNEDVQLSNTYLISTQYKINGVWVQYESIKDTSLMISGNTLTIKPMRTISKTGSYELVVASTAVRDLAGNSAPAFTNVFLRDSIPPKLTQISPDLTLPVALNASFAFTFDEDVRLSSNFGFYTYYRDSVSGQYVEYERLKASQAVINGNVITFTPSLPFMPNRRAQIILTASSVLDMEGNVYQNVTDGTPTTFVSKRFLTATSDSIFVTFVPGDGDSITFIPDELTIAFSGNISLSDNSPADSMNVDSLVYLRHNGTVLEHETSFNPDRNVITIVPAVNLIAGNSYTFGFNNGFKDVAGNLISGQESSFTLIDTLSAVNHYAISEIHGDSIVSPMSGQVVQISGTVTGVYPQEGFFVQDANSAGSGIWVSSTGTSELVVGEGVTVTGMVEMLDNTAVIVADEVAAINTSVIIIPIVINFATDSLQMYQGVLVQGINLRASAADLEGNWRLYAENDTDSLIVSSQMYLYAPTQDNLYNLTGIVTKRNGIFLIEPRIEADVVDVTVPTNVDITPGIAFNVYPNPFGSYVRISNNDKISRVIISNITGQKVVDISYPGPEINTSQLISGIYIISLFNQNNLVKSGRIVKQ